MKKYTLLVLIYSVCACSQNVTKLELVNKTKLKIAEPSDIAINNLTKNTYFVVSDKGFLYEIDENGSILKEAANYEGQDNEAVLHFGSKIYSIEERVRKLRVFNENLELIKTKDLPYYGGRNKAYESLTYNESKKCFVAITEKNPILLMEFDANFEKINEIELKIARDISAATFHNNFLWLISDEDRMLYQVNSVNYAFEKSWKIPVINPEGIAFKTNGNVLILSDDRAILYEFKNPEN